MDEDNLWKATDVAAYLSISKEKVYKMAQKRQIPFIRLGDEKGASIRFKKSEIEKWLSKRTVRPIK